MPTRVSYSRAVTKLHALGNVLKRPLRGVLDSGGRVCAISLAKSTQPFGTGSDAKSKGEKAVIRDIRLIYGNANGAYEAINDTRLKGAFWFHYKKGDHERATGIARKAGVNVGDFDGGTAHKSERRNSRPIISKSTKPKVYIIDPGERKKLERYIELKKSFVGFAKGGWSDVARAISSAGSRARGLREEDDISANWISGKGHGFGKAFHGGTDEAPTLAITNTVPYVSALLSASAQRDAQRIARDRMLLNLEYAVKSEAKNLRSAP